MNYSSICEIESIVDCSREELTKKVEQRVVCVYYHWRKRRLSCFRERGSR